MNIAYFRNSTFSFNKTIEIVKEEAEKNGLKVIGETDLPNKTGKVVHVCKDTWIGNLMSSDHNLIGLLPCSIVVMKKGDIVTVGTGSPSVLGSITQNPAINQLATQAETIMKKIINSSAGVGDLKPKHIRLYSTMTCPYCQMEKSWLESKKVKHDVIYVDLNQKEAEKMVEKTGQMGVPVTEVQYNDTESEYIIGFDKEKLSSILGINS